MRATRLLSTGWSKPVKVRTVLAIRPGRRSPHKPTEHPTTKPQSFTLREDGRPRVVRLYTRDALATWLRQLHRSAQVERLGSRTYRIRISGNGVTARFYIIAALMAL